MKTMVFLFTALLGVQAFADLVVYTDRPQVRFQNAANQFTAKTGQKVVFVEDAYQNLLPKLQAGENADIIMTKDIVFLADLKAKNLLQPIGEFSALSRVQAPAKDSHFTALTLRVRSLVYDSSRVNVDDVNNYSDLARPEWAGRLCLRTSGGTYNVALTAGLIAHYGSANARDILQGWLNNLAADVFKNDISMMEAMVNGTCDVGIANHYYLAQMVDQRPSLPVKIKFLNQDDGGVFSNGSGAGIVAKSSQADLAREFIAILLTDDVQKEISAAHFDYPAVTNLLPTTLIKDWGTYKINPISWGIVGEKVPEAVQMIKDLNYK